MKIKWSEEAQAELDHMLAYIASQDPYAAALVAERVIGMEANILTFPQAAQFDEETGTYDRYIPKTRIILTYAISDDTVEIISVWHTSRNPAEKSRK